MSFAFLPPEGAAGEVPNGAVASDLKYLGSTSVPYGNTITLKAVLSDAETGGPLADEGLTFSFESNGSVAETVSLTTGRSGGAFAWVDLDLPVGPYLLRVRFDGSATHASSEVAVPFISDKHRTDVWIGNLSEPVWGDPWRLSAGLRDLDSNHDHLPGRYLIFELVRDGRVILSDGEWMMGVSAVVELQMDVLPGPYDLVVRYEGDALTHPSSSTAPVVVGPREVRLTLDGPTSVYRGQLANLRVRATDATKSQPVPGRSIELLFDGRYHSGVTDADGIAAIPVQMNVPFGNHPLSFGSSGDEYFQPASSGPLSIEVGWRYVFDDIAGGGTFRVNPATKQFRWTVPFGDSGIRVDSDMQVATLANGEEILPLDHQETTRGTTGVFWLSRRTFGVAIRLGTDTALLRSA